MATQHGATFVQALHAHLAAHEGIRASHHKRVAERAALNPIVRLGAAQAAEREARPATAPQEAQRG